MSHYNTLILVPCHSLFKDSTKPAQSTQKYKNDDAWVLSPFQKGEPAYFLEHIQAGLNALQKNPEALLIFSGGRTRKEAKKWSEAQSYLETAKSLEGWNKKDGKKILTEEFARDSFQNLLYSLCLFKKNTGDWPKRIQVMNWGFKEKRFNFHRQTLGIQDENYSFFGINTPVDLIGAQKGELKTLQAFLKDPYGLNPEEIGKKRVDRNPHKDRHPYFTIKGLKACLNHLENPENEHRAYAGIFPWDQSRARDIWCPPMKLFPALLKQAM